MVCFVHFDLEMCFAPQRRALFRHLNFQKWSDAEVFCSFRLGNVLRTTTACNFSSLIWPAGSAPAALRAYFSTLRSHKSLEKHSVSRLSYLFAHLHLLSSDSFSSTLLSSNLSLLSVSALLCFSSVHIVGSLTSKLPSIKQREKDGMKVYSNTLWECCGILWDYRDFTSKCHGFPAGDMGEMVVHLYTPPKKMDELFGIRDNNGHDS